MKPHFILIIAVFFLTLAYELFYLWRITPGTWPLKLVVTGAFSLWFVVAYAGFALTERFSVKTATILYEVGLPWMIAFLYLLLILGIMVIFVT